MERAGYTNVSPSQDALWRNRGLLKEGEARFVAYSGATLENLRTCAVVTENGLILFDKSLEPRHRDKNVFYHTSLFHASWYAIISSFKLNHIPAVLEGDLPMSRSEPNMLWNGESFPVSRVWLPDRESNWRDFYDKFRPTPEQIEAVFKAVSPLSLLG